MLMKVALVAALTLLVPACGDRTDATPSPFHASDISNVEWGRDFYLTDHHGTPRRLADFQGKVVMLFFGYTHCPDVCLTTLAELAQVVARLGRDGERVQALFVTVDPERDTPQALATFVTAFHPRFLGLYADAGSTAQLAREFKFFNAAQAADTQGHYTVEHGSAVYVYDARGRLRLLMGPGRTVDTMTADVARLLAP